MEDQTDPQCMKVNVQRKEKCVLFTFFLLASVHK